MLGVKIVIEGGGSIGIACFTAKGSACGEADLDIHFSTGGDWAIDGKLFVCLHGEFTVGCLACDDECNGEYLLPCITHGESGEILASGSIHVGNDGFKPSIDLGTDCHYNASGSGDGCFYCCH